MGRDGEIAAGVITHSIPLRKLSLPPLTSQQPSWDLLGRERLQPIGEYPSLTSICSSEKAVGE